jgi:hypothetical protein
MNRKYLSLLSLAIIPALVFGVMQSQPGYVDDGKITTMHGGLMAELTPLEMADRADIIVKAKIVGVDYEADTTKLERGVVKVYSIYEIAPISFIKGNAEGNLFVKVTGGETEKYRTISDNLVLKNNDEVLMHLTVSDDGAPYYNSYGDRINTYVISDGIGKNARQQYVSETQLVNDYRIQVDSLN